MKKAATTASSDRLVVAEFVGCFGVRGELKCRPTSIGAHAIVAGKRYFLEEAGERSIEIAAVRRHHQRLLVSVRGVERVEDAQCLLGSKLRLEREQIVLGKGEFFDDQLLGLHLVDQHGYQAGTVAAVEHYPAQDCLVIEPGRILVPLVRAFIREIDIDRGFIRVEAPPGLLNPKEAEDG